MPPTCRQILPVLSLAALPMLAGGTLEAQPLSARVLADEIITTTAPANNNTTPMWAAGAPMLVRHGETVWASIAVHDAGAEPYCNSHWELWRRPGDDPWAKLHQGDRASEREPCPLFLADVRTLSVSIHPKLLSRPPNSAGQIPAFCQPALVFVELAQPERPPRLLSPPFGPPAEFTEHSYRSVGADPASEAFLLLVMDRESTYHALWREAQGGWRPLRAPDFPVRACYANVALRRRIAHVFAVGDIKEPNPLWREEKTRVLQREWDYVFRRVFYTWSPDVAAEPFHLPLEVDSVEETAGWMFNLDLLVDAQNRVHLLWVRWNIQYPFLRDRFFPGETMVESVMHAVAAEGRIVARSEIFRRTLGTDSSGPTPFTSRRLHELPDGRLLAVLVGEADGQQTPSEPALWLQPLHSHGGKSGPAFHVALTRPPSPGMFFTNTARGGSKTDHNLDILTAEHREDLVALRHIHLHVP